MQTEVIGTFGDIISSMRRNLNVPHCMLQDAYRESIRTQQNATRRMYYHKAKLREKKKKKLSRQLEKDIIRKAISPFLNNATVDGILRGGWKKVKNFTEEEISFAITLKTLSSQAYK